MKNIILKIIRNMMIGIGISMIVFLLISKVYNVDDSILFSLSLSLFIVGLIGGAISIFSDYIKPLIYVSLHFIYSFVALLLLISHFQLVELNFVSGFYIFEVVFTVYIIYAILLFIKDTLNGSIINEKLGVKNNKIDSYIFLCKVFIILAVVWNLLFDLIISIVSSVLIIGSLLYLLHKKVKTKYEIYCIVVTFISLLLSMILLFSVIKVINSGGGVRVGLFNGLLVSIIDIVLNVIIIVISSISFYKNRNIK